MTGVLTDVDPTSLPAGAPLWIYALAIIVPPLAMVVVAILTIVLNRRVGRVEEHARVAAEQTANSHGSNLRDDLDEKFDAANRRIDKLARGHARMSRSMRALIERFDAYIDGADDDPSV